MTKKLSFRSQHSYVELTESASGLYIGAGPLPVFALVNVTYDQAIQMRRMFDDFIRAERHRLNPKCPIIHHAMDCDCRGEHGDR